MALDLGIFLEGSQSTFKVKVSENDAQAQFLLDKFISSDGSVTITETNDGGIETIDLVAGGGGDNFANADLTLDANRTHDLAGFELTITDATNGDLFKVANTGEFLLGRDLTPGSTASPSANILIGRNSSISNGSKILNIGNTNAVTQSSDLSSTSSVIGFSNTISLAGGNTNAFFGNNNNWNSSTFTDDTVVVGSLNTFGGSVFSQSTVDVVLGHGNNLEGSASVLAGSYLGNNASFTCVFGRGNGTGANRLINAAQRSILLGVMSSGTASTSSTTITDNHFLLTRDSDTWLYLGTGSNFGVGTTTPSARLTVQGEGATSATSALLVENSAGADALEVRDDSVIIMANLPTSSSGLPTGAIWNNSGVMNIA